MKVYLLFLLFVILAQSIQPEQTTQTKERRELLIAGGAGIALVAACVSGVVGAVTGALTNEGIRACAGPRERTIVIVQQADGTFVQRPPENHSGKNRRQLQVIEGVSYEGDETCPIDHAILPVAVDKVTKQAAIPDYFFDEERWEGLKENEKEASLELTPKAKWRQKISNVNAEILRTVPRIPATATGKDKTPQQPVVVPDPKTPQQPVVVPDPKAKTAQDPKDTSSQVSSSNSGTFEYAPVIAAASILSFLGGFWVRATCVESKMSTYYEELHNDV